MGLMSFLNTTRLSKGRTTTHQGLVATTYAVKGEGQIELIYVAQGRTESIKIHLKTSPYRSLTVWRSGQHAMQQLREVGQHWWRRVYKTTGTATVGNPTKQVAPRLVLPPEAIGLNPNAVRHKLVLARRDIAVRSPAVQLTPNRSIQLDMQPLAAPPKTQAITAPTLDLRKPADLYTPK